MGLSHFDLLSWFSLSLGLAVLSWGSLLPGARPLCLLFCNSAPSFDILSLLRGAMVFPLL